MKDLQRPIFVVGVARSGTTLLSALLDSHPDIAISPESHYLSYWTRAYRHLDVSRPAQFSEFWSAFTSNNHFRRWGIAADAVRARIERSPVISFRAIFAVMLEEYRTARDKRRVGEKTPEHDQHVARLLEWFPDAHVVYLLRDPRAVVASVMKAPWAPRTVDVHARRWRRSVRDVRLHASDPRITIVRYEALVTQAADALRALCEKLGEPFHAAMLSPERSGGPLAGREPWKEAAGGPIQVASLTAWRQELGKADVAVIEHIARGLMDALGYEHEGRRLSAPERAELLLRAVVRRLGRGLSGTPARPPWSLVADASDQAEPESLLE